MASKGNMGFTPLQVQVLNELGVELWITRPGVDDLSPVSGSLQLSAVEPETKVMPVVADTNPHNEGEASPVAFDLVCMRNSHLLLVAQTSRASDESLLGSLIRISDTVAKGEKFIFKWPQLDSNSGIDAARKAFMAFTSVQANTLKNPVLVVFGREVASLLSENALEPVMSEPEKLSSFGWNGFSCIAVSELESLRSHWQLKRDLCLQLTKLHPDIFRLLPASVLSNPS